jgi:hypothetical protein
VRVDATSRVEHDAHVLAAAWVFFVVVCIPGVVALEIFLHRRASLRIARFVFVPVGRRRLARVNERVDASRAGYRGAEVRREVLLPLRTWGLIGPNGGIVDVTVEPGRRVAAVRMQVPTSPRVEERARVAATLRIDAVRDADGYVLVARALPEGLFFAAGLPIVGAVAFAQRDPAMRIFGLAFVAVVLTGVFQLQWWLSHGALVRQSAAMALASVGEALEAEATPTTGAPPS